MLRAKESPGSPYSAPRGACAALEGLLVLVLAAGYGQESPILLGQLAISLCGVYTNKSAVPEVLPWP